MEIQIVQAKKVYLPASRLGKDEFVVLLLIFLMGSEGLLEERTITRFNRPFFLASNLTKVCEFPLFWEQFLINVLCNDLR